MLSIIYSIAKRNSLSGEPATLFFVQKQILREPVGAVIHGLQRKETLGLVQDTESVVVYLLVAVVSKVASSICKVVEFYATSPKGSSR